MHQLALIDWIILAVYLSAVMLFGIWLGRGQFAAKDYFLGGKSTPWWAVLLSIVATETSTVTFLSVPAVAYAADGDLRFLQLTFGYIIGRILVVVVLLPLYFRGELFTAYEVLGEKLGGTVRRMASALFIVTRTLADGLRLYLTALVLRAVLDFDLPTCVAIIGIATIAYTVFGGIRSVIWNDCVQFIVYTIGGVLAASVLFNKMPGGWEQVHEFAIDHGKLQIIDLSFDLTSKSITFWSGLIGGAFLSFATHGADQMMVQRYLTASSQRAAAQAILASGFVVALQFLLFLLIGVGLAAFYAEFPTNLPERGDEAFITFIVGHVGVGLTGIILAAVFSAAMSTLSSSLNSSATALVSDFLVRGKNAADEPQRALRLGRIATVGFGLIQIGVAIGTDHLAGKQQIVAGVLSIAGFTTGLILGLYLFGIFVRRPTQRAALIGFSAGLAVVGHVAFRTDVSWPWYSVVGTMTTLLVALAWNSFFEKTDGETP